MAKKKFQWVAGEDDQGDSEDLPAGPSKSARKREALAAEVLATELLAQPERVWNAMELEDDVITALRHGQGLKQKGGRSMVALRRHVRYCAGLLRRDDADEIRARLDRHGV